MPIVKARQAINTLQPGQVLKVLATDRGSVKDFQGWVQTAKNLRLLAQETETAERQDIYVHYVQKMA